MRDRGDVLAHARVRARLVGRRVRARRDVVVPLGEQGVGSREQVARNDGFVEDVTLGRQAPRAAQQRDRIGILHVEAGHVGEPAQQPVHARRDRAEPPLELGARRDLQELVGVEREDEVRGLVGERAPDGGRRDVLLQVARHVVLVHDEREALADEAVEDRQRGVVGAVVDDREPVEDRQVVAHEGLDDVRLVADHRHAPQPEAARRRRRRTAHRRPCRRARTGTARAHTPPVVRATSAATRSPNASTAASGEGSRAGVYLSAMSARNGSSIHAICAGSTSSPLGAL